MADIRIYMEDERVGQTFKRSTERQGDRVRTAVRGAASDAADEILARGQDSIEEGGNFGDRWVEAWSVGVSEGGGTTRIDAGFNTSDKTVGVAWPVFEFGATIEGDPMLWIPFGFADDAKGLYARAYPGPLFRVDRQSDGLPMLWTWEPGTPGSAKPKYFGKESVTIPQKWHLRDIIREVSREISTFFKDRMSE